MLPLNFNELCNRYITDCILYTNSNISDLWYNKVDIEYEISNSLDFQWKSSYKDGKYKIILNIWVFQRVYTIFDTLLAETNNSDGTKWLYYKLSLDYEYNKDKALLYLDLLFCFSVKIIIYHEIWHIINGHLKYKSSLSWQSESSLYTNKINDDWLLEPIERQLLELDADCFAASHLVWNLTFQDTIDYINLNLKWAIKDNQHSLLILIISSVVVFSIMWLWEVRDKKDFKELSYLPLRTRHYYYLRTLLNSYFLINKVKPEITIEFLEEVIPNIEISVYLFNKAYWIYNNESITNNLNELDFYHKSHCDYLDSLRNGYFREKLNKYSHVKLIA